MEQTGFVRYGYNFFGRELGPASGPGSCGGHNQLWIRDLPFVQKRCRTAPPVRVKEMEM